MIQIHTISRKNSLKDKKRVGRGGKKGVYSGRGLKGQKARAGRKLKPMVKEILKKYHKIRGYRFSPVSKKPIPVKLSLLENKFDDGSEITLKLMIDKKIANPVKSSMSPCVKVLCDKNEISKKIIIKGKGIAVSSKAKSIIEKAGGKIVE